MRRRTYELPYALGAMILIVAAYVSATTWLGEAPASSELLGHSLGVIGFLMMLMTETLYSFRKRSTRARWGRMSTWLQFHIFTGLVGPFLVFLHTSWKFNGLAGVVTLMMGLVVFSGFLGRYIYTAVPRTADGVELEASELEHQIAATEAELQLQLAESNDETKTLVARLDVEPAVSGAGWLLVLGRVLADWGYRLRWWRERSRVVAQTRTQAKELNRLLRRRRRLRRQAQSLALARRMLAVWRAVHIPIGVALFVSAFVHIGGAIYYATLLR
jgi:hypothetical protein